MITRYKIVELNGHWNSKQEVLDAISEKHRPREEQIIEIND